MWRACGSRALRKRRSRRLLETTNSLEHTIAAERQTAPEDDRRRESEPVRSLAAVLTYAVMS